MGEASTASGMPDELLIFEQAGQLFALPSSVVKEVLRAFSATPLPNAPPMVEGILNVRGDIIPLINLRKRLGLPDRPLSLTDHFIVARDGNRLIALRVDRVLNLQRVPHRRPLDPGRFATGSEVISSVAATPDGMVLIHDLGRFLSQAERTQLDVAVNVSAAQRKPLREPQK